jgi:hypothetical protein
VLPEALLDDLGGVDFVITSSGTGHLNRELDRASDRDARAVNIVASRRCGGRGLCARSSPRRRLPMAVTEAQPGFIDAAVVKAKQLFWIASGDGGQPDDCGHRRRAKHVYVT